MPIIVRSCLQIVRFRIIVQVDKHVKCVKYGLSFLVGKIQAMGLTVDLLGFLSLAQVFKTLKTQNVEFALHFISNSHFVLVRGRIIYNSLIISKIAGLLCGLDVKFFLSVFYWVDLVDRG